MSDGSSARRTGTYCVAGKTRRAGGSAS
jgi:hypothetical protein